MRTLRPGAVLLVLLPTSAACLEDRGGGQGGGYVAESVSSDASTVRIAWQHQDPATRELRASLRGEVPIEGGAFDVGALLESVGAFEPPVHRCLDVMNRQDDTATVDPEAVDFAVGGIVATAGEIPSGDLDGPQMAEAIEAAALDVAVVWSASDVPRDSATGQLLESSLGAGLQLARLRPCRVPVECQGVEDVEMKITGQPDSDLCLDPWPDHGMVLLQPMAFGQ